MEYGEGAGNPVGQMVVMPGGYAVPSTALSLGGVTDIPRGPAMYALATPIMVAASGVPFGAQQQSVAGYVPSYPQHYGGRVNNRGMGFDLPAPPFRRSEGPRGPPRACLFVANLSTSTTFNGLNAFMQQWGRVLKLNMMKDKADRMYAFCQFQEESDAEQAIKQGNGLVLNGLPVRLAHAKASRTLFFARLGSEVTPHLLRRVGEVYGPVQRADLVISRQSGKSKGCGFVKFVYREDAIDAFQTLKASEYRGWVVEWATSLHDPDATPPDRYQVFVGGLNAEKVTEEILEQVFSKIGPVDQITLVKKPIPIQHDEEYGAGFPESAFDEPDSAFQSGMERSGSDTLLAPSPPLMQPVAAPRGSTDDGSTGPSPQPPGAAFQSSSGEPTFGSTAGVAGVGEVAPVGVNGVGQAPTSAFTATTLGSSPATSSSGAVPDSSATSTATATAASSSSPAAAAASNRPSRISRSRSAMAVSTKPADPAVPAEVPQGPPPTSNSGRRKDAFGFIRFCDETSAARAIAELDGFELLERRIRVQFCETTEMKHHRKQQKKKVPVFAGSGHMQGHPAMPVPHDPSAAGGTGPGPIADALRTSSNCSPRSSSSSSLRNSGGSDADSAGPNASATGYILPSLWSGPPSPVLTTRRQRRRSTGTISSLSSGTSEASPSGTLTTNGTASQFAGVSQSPGGPSAGPPAPGGRGALPPGVMSAEDLANQMQAMRVYEAYVYQRQAAMMQSGHQGMTSPVDIRDVHLRPVGPYPFARTNSGNAVAGLAGVPGVQGVQVPGVAGMPGMPGGDQMPGSAMPMGYPFSGAWYVQYPGGVSPAYGEHVLVGSPVMTATPHGYYPGPDHGSMGYRPQQPGLVSIVGWS